MKIAELPNNEEERLKLIYELDILDTDLEEAYDAMTLIASMICQTPIALITIVDKNRQWFKSHQGLDVEETPRDYAFCAHTILKQDIMYVPNAHLDERFKDNPLVVGDPYVIFYTGIPLQIGELRIGSLCVIDHQPKTLSEDQLKALDGLAKQVVKLLELRLKIKENEYLRENEKQTIGILTHDLCNPLTSIIGYLSIMTMDKNKFNHEAYTPLIASCIIRFA